MGKPGAGKGTQATKLLKHYQLTHISTGDIYREEMQKESPIGLIAKEYVSRGELVPDDITNDIVEEVLKKKDYPNGFMLDGYPRNRAQAEALDCILAHLGIKLSAVINVDVNDELCCAAWPAGEFARTVKKPIMLIFTLLKSRASVTYVVIN